MAMIRWAKLGHSDQVVAPTAARTREQSSIEPGGPLGGPFSARTAPIARIAPHR